MIGGSDPDPSPDRRGESGAGSDPGLRAAGAVLTGGASRRMGSDKALVEIDGVPMAVRVARALTVAGCDPVWCQGGHADALAALALTVCPDTTPGQGPLPAILDALTRATGRGRAAMGVVVAACDVPDLTPDAVARLLAERAGDVPATLTVDGVPQLVGWWPIGVAAALGGLLATGTRSYRQALHQLGAHHVAVPGLRNVNTPGDL